MRTLITRIAGGVLLVAAIVIGLTITTAQPAAATNNQNQNNNQQNRQYQQQGKNLPEAGPGEVIAVVVLATVTGIVSYEMILWRQLRQRA